MSEEDNKRIPAKEVTASSSGGDTGSVGLIATLAFAGLVSGMAIIGIYETTLPTITENKARELKAAVFKVLPDINQMHKLIYEDGKITVIPQDQAADDPIYGGYDKSGRFVGYAIPAEGKGFQDTISILYGYRRDTHRVTGMEVLDSRETPGLGDKIYKDAHFVAEFKNLAVDPQIIAVKKGKKTSDNQIDAITGATISSKAIVNNINRSNKIWFERLPEAGNEPEMHGMSDNELDAGSEE